MAAQGTSSLLRAATSMIVRRGGASSPLPALGAAAPTRWLAAAQGLHTAQGVGAQAAQEAAEVGSRLPDVDVQSQRGSRTLSREATVRRLLYRSQQRGFLELDLIVRRKYPEGAAALRALRALRNERTQGRWVEEHIHGMNEEHLHHLIVVLDQENPDLYKWLTEQAPAPAHLLENPVYQGLLSRTKEFLNGLAPTAARAQQGTEWTKAWSDSGKELPKKPEAAKWYDTQ